ncbi:MAG TPA: hypothetical protein VKR31_07965 [Rhizomicrobium sp.]|nr:hypothetical protein [Rhizomicrobium sp.]
MKTMLLVGVVALSASAAIAASDNFDRSKLGHKWVVTDGHLYIANDQLQAKSAGLGYDTKSASSWGASATVTLNGTDVEYGAVALGDIAGGNNAFIKIQSQDGDGLFEYGAFYIGDNGEGEFFPLNEPASSPATISAWFCGTYGFLQVKSASGSHKYYYNYNTDFGYGAGLGAGGAASLDNYKSGQGDCSGDMKNATRVFPSPVRDLSK